MIASMTCSESISRASASNVSTTRCRSTRCASAFTSSGITYARPASIAFLHAARALALLAGRAYVIPEDVKSLAHRVLRHRVVLTFEADALEIDSEQVIDAIIAAIPAP